MEIIHLVMGKANPARMNGVNKVVYQLATRQTAAGLNVSVWGFTKTPEADYGERNFRTVLFREDRNPFALDPAFRRALGDLDREGTVFHLHGGWVPLFSRAAAALHRAGLRYVITPHGAYNTRAMEKGRWRKKLYFRLFERSLLRHAAAIHCIGASEVDGLQTIYKTDKTVLLPYGMDMVGTQRAEARAEDGFVFGFVGRLDYYTKGLDLLLDAFAAHIRTDEDAVLWIVGDGDGRAAVEEKIATLGIEDRVVLHGSRYGEDKDALLRRMRVFLHPSRNEGMPSAVLEAAAFGVPCIVTEATNIGDYVREYGAGRVVPNEDDRALALAMGECRGLGGGTLLELGSNASRMVATAFSWPEVVVRFNKLYA
ncbi:glycosyltransferase involved in cell wall biosynthesis [Neolewinella xylanilytica]|uniref:Glycosyltransferase involved in cell wall biosynthesis n=1 Tax=Neolewinella xylanilytica TaxID=1514080 RepID=A0A2S6I8N2_9BACT|nr:glycosyltransferase [Neolewinella xylanilytica]PPK87839.1 glycosyltransferase involved in cell wall biosynthesis [Neolewinella xylanilytica]